MYFINTRKVENTHKAFINYVFDIHAFCQIPLLSSLLRGRREGLQTSLPHLSLPSVPVFSVVSGRLIQASDMNTRSLARKNASWRQVNTKNSARKVDQVSWWPVFLRPSLCFVYVVSKFHYNGECGILGLSEPQLVSHRCDRLFVLSLFGVRLTSWRPVQYWMKAARRSGAAPSLLTDVVCVSLWFTDLPVQRRDYHE